MLRDFGLHIHLSWLVMGMRNCIVLILLENNTFLFMEIESLERQLEEIQVENFNIKQMKDLFEQKAAQLATEIVGKCISMRSDSLLVQFVKGIIYSTSFLLDLKSKYDEEISLREGAEQKVTNLRQELQKERSTVEDLKTELVFTSH